MKPIEQTRFYVPGDSIFEPDRERGNCLSACIASIFEVSIEDAESAAEYASNTREWVEARFPGVSIAERELGKRPRDRAEILTDYQSWPSEAPYHNGFWIGTFWSPRILDRPMYGCGCPWDEQDNFVGANPDCRWCAGEPLRRYMGVDWGMHAVVMKGGKVAWDPHSLSRERKEYNYWRAEMTIVVTDPSKLIRA